ncbi:hypothetical protein BFP97_01750 [Roseivirga sp. 4D4]|nr:hypothetical protein BFP97_01750 [Roseivirga sp. 4D4]
MTIMYSTVLRMLQLVSICSEFLFLFLEKSIDLECEGVRSHSLQPKHMLKNTLQEHISALEHLVVAPNKTLLK